MEKDHVLRFMGSQRVRHDWATDLIWWFSLMCGRNQHNTVKQLFFIWKEKKNIGVGCHFLLQGIFLTQGSYPHLLWQADLGSPLEKVKAISSHPWDETGRAEEREPKRIRLSLLFSSFLKKKKSKNTSNTPCTNLKLNAPFCNLKAWLNFKETGGGGGGTLYERVVFFLK